MLTAYGSITNAVRAIKEGAFEYLTKPITQEELELNVARAMENLALKRNYVFVRDQQRAARPGVVVGTSEAMNTLMGLVNAVAQSNATVLIHGESGAGKEVIAHEIHERSPRAGRNYVALDCCTLQDNLFESELFGHERGAFTGANALKRGLVEAADGGTLFLDEIGEISPAAQAKLLRVIETKQYRRVGGTKDLAGDVRIVAATNRDLAEMAREGRFRADLYYRLSAFELKVPPLRQRREDIPALAGHFIEKHDFSRRVVKKLSPAAERALIEYDWPGNVRELRNVIERAIILSGSDGTIKLPHVTLSDAAQARGAITLSFEREVKLEDVKRAYVESHAPEIFGAPLKARARAGRQRAQSLPAFAQIRARITGKGLHADRTRHERRCRRHLGDHRPYDTGRRNLCASAGHERGGSARLLDGTGPRDVRGRGRRAHPRHLLPEG